MTRQINGLFLARKASFPMGIVIDLIAGPSGSGQLELR